MHLFHRLLSRLVVMALVLLRLLVMDLLLAIAARVQGGVGLLQRTCFPLAQSPSVPRSGPENYSEGNKKNFHGQC
jgi:hypothetical protein